MASSNSNFVANAFFAHSPPINPCVLTGMSHNNANTVIVYRFFQNERFVTGTVHSLIVALFLSRSGCIIYHFRANLTLYSGETKNGF